MSKAKRLTDTEKWRDPWFHSLPPTLKLLWLYILDNCDHAGIWKLSKDHAQFDLGDIPEWGESQECVPKEFGQRVISRGGYWFILKFMTFQYGQNLNRGDAVLSALEIIDSKGFSEDLVRVIGHSIDPLVRAKAKAKAKDRGVGEGFFKQFWEVYPKKNNRAKVKSWWILNQPNPELFEKIMSALNAWKATEQWTKDDGKYVLNPLAWLEGQRWEDDLPKEQEQWIDKIDLANPVKRR